MVRRALSVVVAGLVPLAGVAVAAPPSADAAPPARAATTAAAPEEPHSPAGRTPARLTVRTTRTAVVREVDLGDIDLGPRSNPGTYRAPVRGTLITSRKAKAHAPLVVFGHLRMPGCADMAVRYPCAKGVQEIRYDRGMAWLGEALAARGYSMLIPDLAPIYTPQNLEKPYDQQAAWLRATGMLRAQALAGNAGKRSAWGSGLTGMIDGRDTTLMTHSRSTYFIPAIVKAWKKSPTPIGQILVYGGAYDTISTEHPPVPLPADVPFLDIAGTADGDVDHSASQWMTELIGRRRTAPGFHVDVEGLGHTFINRELSRRRIDDRNGDGNRPTAADHEKLLLKATLGWLDQTVRGKHVFPMKATEPLPNALIGTPARYLVATPGAQVQLVSNQGRWATPLGRRASVKVCRNFSRMDPTKYSYRCPDVDDGIVIPDSYVTRVKLGPGVGARIAAKARNPQLVALHLTPTRDRKDKLGYTPLRLTVRMSDGRRYSVDLGKRYNALREWPHPYGVGEYYVQTARVPLPTGARRGTMVGLDLTAPRAGEIELRGVDVL